METYPLSRWRPPQSQAHDSDSRSSPISLPTIPTYTHINQNWIVDARDYEIMFVPPKQMKASWEEEEKKSGKKDKTIYSPLGQLYVHMHAGGLDNCLCDLLDI